MGQAGHERGEAAMIGAWKVWLWRNLVAQSPSPFPRSSVARGAVSGCRRLPAAIERARADNGQKQTFDIQLNLELSSLVMVVRIAACSPLLGECP